VDLLHSLQTWGANYPFQQCHILEELISSIRPLERTTPFNLIMLFISGVPNMVVCVEGSNYVLLFSGWNPIP
jgi:hypothetical protein